MDDEGRLPRFCEEGVWIRTAMERPAAFVAAVISPPAFLLLLAAATAAAFNAMTRGELFAECVLGLTTAEELKLVEEVW